MFFLPLTIPYNYRNMNIFVCVCCRLIAERGEELTVDRLNKDLKTLVKQTKGIKYGEVMKLLRLALSGLQVPEGTMVVYKL